MLGEMGMELSDIRKYFETHESIEDMVLQENFEVLTNLSITVIKEKVQGYAGKEILPGEMSLFKLRKKQ
jgi:hypothetical protein